MALEELKWQNIDADDLPAEVKKSFDAMVEAEAAGRSGICRSVLDSITGARDVATHNDILRCNIGASDA